MISPNTVCRSRALNVSASPGPEGEAIPWVAISVVIAIVASTVAIWFAFISQTVIIRLCGSSLGLAIAGIHYTGVAGFICTPVKGETFVLPGISPKGLAPWVWIRMRGKFHSPPPSGK
jgi:hypothetical protein